MIIYIQTSSMSILRCFPLRVSDNSTLGSGMLGPGSPYTEVLFIVRFIFTDCCSLSSTTLLC